MASFEYVSPLNARFYPYLPVCPSAHTGKVDGAWERGDNDIFEVVVTGNGVPQFKTRCKGCGQRGGPVPHAVAQDWITTYGVDHIRRNTPTQYPACTYRDCTLPGAEQHHFAPRNTFGDEADDWPVLPLCREHHVRWHTLMDGYRWHRRASA